MIILRRIILITAVIAIFYFSLAMRTGNVAPDDFVFEKEVTKVTSWQIPAETTLIEKSSEALQEKNMALAKRFALQAWSKNITSGRASVQLLTVHAAEEDTQNGDKVAELTSQLWPAHSLTRAKLADYWNEREDFSKVLPEWNTLLIRDRGIRKKLFPLLKQLVNNPQTFNLLQSFMQDPPNWWDDFFIYLTKDKESLEAIKKVYSVRLNTEKPLEQNERRYFVLRLIREKQMTEAYFSWLSGLNSKELALSGLIYDGGFEGDSFNTGFDWTFSQPKGVKIRTQTTSGINGAKALQITLNHKRLNFRHIYQRLALNSGNYQLSGRFRINRLKTEKGLSWRIYCVGSKTLKIAESMAFKGRLPWSEFQTSFTIPVENCDSQLLRLEASSPYAHQHTFKGSLWFDDMAVSGIINSQEQDQ